MPPSVRRALPALVALLTLAGCSSSSEPDDALNLTGTWTGTLTLTATDGAMTEPWVLTLVHSGANVTGSAAFEEDVPATGSLSGSTLTLTFTATQSQSDDCHLYSVTLGFDATASTLTASSGTGQLCDGNGQGGHEALHTITDASGSLTRG